MKGMDAVVWASIDSIMKGDADLDHEITNVANKMVDIASTTLPPKVQ